TVAPADRQYHGTPANVRRADIMPRFSANLGLLWAELPLLQRIDRAAAAGFRAIALHWPSAVPARQVRAACQRRGLTLLCINTAPGDRNKGEFGLGALPGREAEFQHTVDQAISYCQNAGAGALHIMPGIISGHAKPTASTVFRNNLVRAADKAAQAGLTVLLEPLNPRDHPDYLYSTLAEAVALIEAVGRTNVKLMFDVYHVAIAEGDILTKLARYRDLIGHIQIAAVPSRAEPDEGEIAYQAIFDALDA